MEAVPDSLHPRRASSGLELAMPLLLALPAGGPGANRHRHNALRALPRRHLRRRALRHAPGGWPTSARVTPGPNTNGLPRRITPAGILARDRIFLVSLAISLGLILWWAHAAPIPPAQAWPLAVIANFLPVIAFLRTSTADRAGNADVSPPRRPSRYAATWPIGTVSGSGDKF